MITQVVEIVSALGSLALLAVTIIYAQLTSRIARETAKSARASEMSARASLLTLILQNASSVEPAGVDVIFDVRGKVHRIDVRVVNRGRGPLNNAAIRWGGVVTDRKDIPAGGSTSWAVFPSSSSEGLTEGGGWDADFTVDGRDVLGFSGVSRMRVGHRPGESSTIGLLGQTLAGQSLTEFSLGDLLKQNLT